MNEGTKTGIFWVFAVVMIGVAGFVSWPTPVDDSVDIGIGRPLFEQFTDPLAAASMKIVTFDEEEGDVETFEVRRDSETGLWTIPSRDGYPADALEQMKEAANAFVGLKILDVQTSAAEDHDDLGVSEPKNLAPGDEGVGRLVTFKDEKQETLASLIIGDSVKDDPEKKYVRIPGQDPVYVVKLDESTLTTRFRDWIEDDLLKLSSIDITEMEIKDYTAGVGANGQLDWTRTFDAVVAVDGAGWKLKRMVQYDPTNPRAQPTPVELPEGQSLNTTRLDLMRNALDDLKIADVLRKPEGMSANLRANQDLLADSDAIASLGQRGFYPVQTSPGETEIVAANGELSATLNDGVKYIMRFGNISGVTKKEDLGGDQEDPNEAGVNRYLLVTAAVDESQFPMPELRKVPQTLEDLDALLKSETESESTSDGGDAVVPDDEQLTEEERLERLEAEQEKITKDNQRRLDERNQRLERAQRRVRELNNRFADWYYVIPEDTYSMLRIKRDELLGQTPATTLPSTPIIPQFEFPGPQ